MKNSEGLVTVSINNIYLSLYLSIFHPYSPLSLDMPLLSRVYVRVG